MPSTRESVTGAPPMPCIGPVPVESAGAPRRPRRATAQPHDTAPYRRPPRGQASTRVHTARPPRKTARRPAPQVPRPPPRPSADRTQDQCPTGAGTVPNGRRTGAERAQERVKPPPGGCPDGGLSAGGRCRIRTYVGKSRRIYSPLPLAARATCRASPSGGNGRCTAAGTEPGPHRRPRCAVGRGGKTTRSPRGACKSAGTPPRAGGGAPAPAASVGRGCGAGGRTCGTRSEPRTTTDTEEWIRWQIRRSTW